MHTGMKTPGRFVGRVLSRPVFSTKTTARTIFSGDAPDRPAVGAEDTLPPAGQPHPAGAVAGVCRGRLAAEGRCAPSTTAPGWGKLVLAVFVRALCAAEKDEPDCNQLTLQGTLCRVPVYRRTPLGQEDLRPDAGGEPALWPGGLPSLHLLGRGGPGLRRG